MIPITRPWFGPEEEEALLRPLRSGWVVQGPEVAAFEADFATYTGAAHAIATSSCTTALHIAVAALGLQPGDEVLVPAFTWVSTANVVEYMGARPVFVDVDPVTFNIETNDLEAHINDRTVGIIPVHLFGLAAEMGPVSALAKRHGLWVVEDAACGFGTQYDGKHVGTLSDAGCFSFHPRKSITTGEGGMITTERTDMDALARSLRDHGATRADLERHLSSRSFLLAEYPNLGYNFRMTDIQGALGRVQMTRGDLILERRRALARRYDELLGDLEWLRTPVVPPGHVHGYQAYVCRLLPDLTDLRRMEEANVLRDAILMDMENAGIATRQGTHAAALQTYYQKKYDLRTEGFPQAALSERLSLALPLYPQMTTAEQDRVVRELVDAARRHGL